MAPATILVQLESSTWTRVALTKACEEARQKNIGVTLVKLLPDTFLAWLCDDPDTYCFSEAETADIGRYEALAAEYGVPLTIRVFQYHDLEQGILRAADELNAVSVYAVVPPSVVPFQHDLPLLNLAFQLHSRNHAFHPVQVALH